MNKEEFISAATKIYGDQYDFSEVTEQGVKYNTNVAIRCNKHGLFWTTPMHILGGDIGCYECLKEKRKKNNEKG